MVAFSNIFRTFLQGTSRKDVWHLRESLSKPKIQRDEQVPLKVYYVPEWKTSHINPLKKYGITPEKWEFYNKVLKNYFLLLVL